MSSKKRAPRPNHTPPTGDHGSVPHFWECPGCGYLTSDPRVGSGEKSCPGCKWHDGPPRVFPPDRLRRLDERIRHYFGDGESEIVVILVATFLETMLEDVLARIMETQGADVRLRAAVLDGQRAIGQRLGRLFPTLTGTQFEDAAAQLGYRDFPKRWRDLRQARNAFIHDTAFEGPLHALDQRLARQAMALLDEAYHLFVGINNRYVAMPGRSAMVSE